MASVSRVLMVGSHIHLVEQTEACLESALRDTGLTVSTFDFRACAAVPRFLTRLIPSRLRYRFSPRRLPAVERIDASASNRQFVSLLSDFRPDLVLALRAERVNAASISAAREMGAVTFNWTLDEPWQYVPSEVVPAYDLWMVIDRTWGEWLLEKGAQRLEHFPLGCDPSLHKPVELSPEERQHWHSSLCFVGGYLPIREKILSAVADMGLAIWGPGWDRAENPLVRRCVREGRSLSRQEWLKAYAAADVVINVHTQGPENLNLRAWEALAAGVCLLSDYRADLDRFLPGEVASYRDAEEMRQQCRELLSDPEKRKRLAYRAREKALSSHTFVHRVQEILRLAETCRGNND